MPDCQMRKNTKNPNLEKKNGRGGGEGREGGGGGWSKRVPAAYEFPIYKYITTNNISSS